MRCFDRGTFLQSGGVPARVATRDGPPSHIGIERAWATPTYLRPGRDWKFVSGVVGAKEKALWRTGSVHVRPSCCVPMPGRTWQDPLDSVSAFFDRPRRTSCRPFGVQSLQYRARIIDDHFGPPSRSDFHHCLSSSVVNQSQDRSCLGRQAWRIPRLACSGQHSRNAVTEGFALGSQRFVQCNRHSLTTKSLLARCAWALLAHISIAIVARNPLHQVAGDRRPGRIRRDDPCWCQTGSRVSSRTPRATNVRLIITGIFEREL